MCTVNKSVHTKKVWKLIECTSYKVVATEEKLNSSSRVKKISPLHKLLLLLMTLLTSSDETFSG